jgi:hypothetical protein
MDAFGQAIGSSGYLISMEYGKTAVFPGSSGSVSFDGPSLMVRRGVLEGVVTV